MISQTNKMIPNITFMKAATKLPGSCTKTETNTRLQIIEIKKNVNAEMSF